MFGGIQINGQDTNNIYKRVGDLTIASPSLSSIILKTNYGNWEAMRLNSSGISMNTSLYISGVTTLNNTTTCLSSLNVSGTTVLNNQLTCLSSLSVSGTSNLGPLYINKLKIHFFKLEQQEIYYLLKQVHIQHLDVLKVHLIHI